MQQPPDNFSYIVLVESTYHTDEQPFCFTDGNCPCHEDQEAVKRVEEWIQEGLLTPQEATNYISGKIF